MDTIARVWWESGQQADGAPTEGPTLDQLRARIDVEMAAGWAVTVASLAGELIGFVALKPDAAILDQLFVLPSAQRRGVGQALLGAAEAALPTGFTLSTAAANLRARRFYETAGLVLTAEGPLHGFPVCFYAWSGA